MSKWWDSSTFWKSVGISLLTGSVNSGVQYYSAEKQTEALEEAAKAQGTVTPSVDVPASQESSSEAAAQERRRLKKSAAASRSGTQKTSGGGTSL